MWPENLLGCDAILFTISNMFFIPIIDNTVKGGIIGEIYLILNTAVLRAINI